MNQVAVIAGAGPGLGKALGRKFLREGCRVGLLARSAASLRNLEAELRQEAPAGSTVGTLAVPCDMMNPQQVTSAFKRVRETLGPVEILINHASQSAWKGLLDLSLEEFESAWRVAAYGALLCTREVVPDMLRKGSGTILFTGATSSIRGRGGALDFSSAKFAVRGMAESLARELWPKGIHVAHVVIDGVIGQPEARRQSTAAPSGPWLDPAAIAEAYWSLVTQAPSAWTLELDLRPFQEEFFV
jgi:NAD(P)-dependent dehydrogenase (short-subunit alcohol dehydrogenase family)